MKFRILIAACLLFIASTAIMAQTSATIPLECGAILEREVTVDDPVAEYTLEMSAGTQVTLITEPIGQGFNIFLQLLDSGRNSVFVQNNTIQGGNEEVIDYTISSSNSIFQVMGAFPEYTGTSVGWTVPGRYGGTHYGAFILSVDCILRDGTRIPAGSTVDPQDVPVTSSVPDFGFPGLSPVDFSDGISIPLTVDAPNSGAINPGFESVFGFSFSANEGDAISLDFERLSGNLNLGLAVISDTNQIAYMAALVSSQQMSTSFFLPSTGEYTIGVFQIDLVPPASPESTSFTIQATINQ